MAQLLPRGLAALCRCVLCGIVWTYLYIKMYGNQSNYKLMQQTRTVVCTYKNSCNWHERQRTLTELRFINNLNSKVGVTEL